MAGRKYFGLDLVLETLLLDENNEIEDEASPATDTTNIELAASIPSQLSSCEGSSIQEELESRMQLACPSAATTPTTATRTIAVATTSHSDTDSAPTGAADDSPDSCSILQEIKAFLLSDCCSLQCQKQFIESEVYNYRLSLEELDSTQKELLIMGKMLALTCFFILILQKLYTANHCCMIFFVMNNNNNSNHHESHLGLLACSR